MIWRRIAILGFVSTMVSPSGNAQNVLTPEDAVAIGLKNNFSISIARNDAEVAENNKTRGTANFLPLLNASGSYGYTESKTSTNSPFSFGDTKITSKAASLSLDWTIFDGFRMFADNARYHDLAAMGREHARTLIESEVVRILRAYYNLALQEQLLSVAKTTLAVSETRLEREEARRDLGGASTTDYLNARVSYNNDRNELSNLELQVLTAKNDLNRLLGREPATEVTVEGTVEIPHLRYDYPQLVEMSLQNNSRIKAAKANLDVSKHAVTVDRAAFLPRIWINGTYGYSDRLTLSSREDLGVNREITSEAVDKSINLMFSYNLFNGFRDQTSSENARIEVMNQELLLKDEELFVRSEVRRMYDTYGKQLELVRLAEENIIAAEQNQDLMRERYTTGTATSLEFRDAQVNAARSRNTLLASRFQARITLLEIEQLIGQIQIGKVVEE